MRIVHATIDLGMGGAERVLTSLAISQHRLGHRVCVVVFSSKALDFLPDLQAAGVSVRVLRGSLWQRLAQLFRFFREEKPDVMQSWMYDADLAAGMVARLARVPVICWNIRCRGDHSPWSVRLRRPLVGLLSYVIPARVVVNSQAAQTCHERLGFSRSRWALIPNGFDLNRFCPADVSVARARLGYEKDSRFWMLSVGRFHADKNHAGLLKAMARVIQQTAVPVVLVLVGKGCDKGNRELAGMIQQEGLQDRVLLVGNVQQTECWYQASDGFVLSSRTESFPNVLGEAMACGLPCVATDVGDVRAVMADTGFVVPPDDNNALISGLLKILALSEEERHTMGMRARARMVSAYSLENMLAQYETLYADEVRRRC